VRERVERLRATLTEPFLVTDLVNIRYLTGFRSSNAALLVEPGRVRLFSDFRYAVAGRAVPDVEFVEAERSLVADLAQRLSGRVAFEADRLSYGQWETLASEGLELVQTRGVVEALRAVKNEQELEAIRAAAAVTTRAFEALAEERFIGRDERELARRLEQLLQEDGGEGLAFAPVVAAGPNGVTARGPR
jgi:Xaa-Pro aminopeptidase